MRRGLSAASTLRTSTTADADVGRALDAVALSATLHCLTGCAIGEVLGMVIGTAPGFSDLGDHRARDRARLLLRLPPHEPAAPALGPGPRRRRPDRARLRHLASRSWRSSTTRSCCSSPARWRPALDDVLFWGALRSRWWSPGVRLAAQPLADRAAARAMRSSTRPASTAACRRASSARSPSPRRSSAPPSSSPPRNRGAQRSSRRAPRRAQRAGGEWSPCPPPPPPSRSVQPAPVRRAAGARPGSPSFATASSRPPS